MIFHFSEVLNLLSIANRAILGVGLALAVGMGWAFPPRRGFHRDKLYNNHVHDIYCRFTPKDTRISEEITYETYARRAT